MPSPLTEMEVNRLSQLLNNEQLSFLQSYLKQSKKSKWLEKLAHKKGIVLHSNISIDEVWEKLNDWELTEILDGGYGKRSYQCECGVKLRFCYIVHHRKDNKTYQLGETCLGNYTMMSPELIKDISNGFHKIDLERDEILIRYEQGWQLPSDYTELPLPQEMNLQIELGLPLSLMQEQKIEKMFQRELWRMRQQRKRESIAERARQLTSFLDNYEESPPSFPNTNSVTYDEVIEQHLDSLKRIREHEQKITNPEMMSKWTELQVMIKNLKRGEAINYSRFLSQMFELLYYLNLY